MGSASEVAYPVRGERPVQTVQCETGSSTFPADQDELAEQHGESEIPEEECLPHRSRSLNGNERPVCRFYVRG